MQKKKIILACLDINYSELFKTVLMNHFSLLIIAFAFFCYFKTNAQDQNCDFARTEYLRLNPDVARANMDPWYHYNQHGKKEGRKWAECISDEDLEWDIIEIDYNPNDTIIRVPSKNQLTQNSAQNNNQSNLNSVTDIDGNTYKVVTLGTQTWMAENLRVTRYNDGTQIPKNVLSFARNNENSELQGFINPESIQYVPNDVIIKEDGLLYSVYVVNNGNVCPQGFKIPSIYDYYTLWSNFINEGDDPVPAILKQHKEYTYPYTGTTGGYYKKELVKCSNCSYWTDQQRLYNPCSVCKNKKSWYVNGEYVPKTNFNAKAVFSTGKIIGTNSLGLSLDNVGMWESGNQKFVQWTDYWTSSEEDRSYDDKLWYYVLYIHEDGTVFIPSKDHSSCAGSFNPIRCIKSE